ncbi:MAG: Fe-S-containing hydro-lyase [bacterium]
MKSEIRLVTPLSNEDVEKLKVGNKVLLNGVIYTARDAAHKRLVETLKKGEKLPFNPEGQVIYYVGPAPARPGKVIGPAGPTTSYRMDPYAIYLMEAGIKGMIGKGSRSQKVKDAMRKYRAVYFAAIGGAAALLSGHIKKAEVIAYEDLGTEAIRKLEVEDFPVIVVNDVKGGDLYEEGARLYSRS